jgi:hypothetical protein
MLLLVVCLWKINVIIIINGAAMHGAQMGHMVQGHIVQGAFFQGTYCQRDASSKNKLSGTHRISHKVPVSQHPSLQFRDNVTKGHPRFS